MSLLWLFHIILDVILSLRLKDIVGIVKKILIWVWSAQTEVKRSNPYLETIHGFFENEQEQIIKKLENADDYRKMYKIRYDRRKHYDIVFEISVKPETAGRYFGWRIEDINIDDARSR